MHVTELSYPVFTEASYFYYWHKNVFDGGKINWKLFGLRAESINLSKTEILYKTWVELFPVKPPLCRLGEGLWFLIICSDLSVFKMYQMKMAALNLLKLIRPRWSWKWVGTVLLLTPHPHPSPFTNVFNALATKGQETACMRVRAAGGCWGRSVASAVLERMSPASSSFQAAFLIRAPHTGPPAVLAGTGRQLGFIISVLMAESHLDKRRKEKLR